MFLAISKYYLGNKLMYRIIDTDDFVCDDCGIEEIKSYINDGTEISNMTINNNENLVGLNFNLGLLGQVGTTNSPAYCISKNCRYGDSKVVSYDLVDCNGKVTTFSPRLVSVILEYNKGVNIGFKASIEPCKYYEDDGNGLVTFDYRIYKRNL